MVRLNIVIVSLLYVDRCINLTVKWLESRFTVHQRKVTISLCFVDDLMVSLKKLGARPAWRVAECLLLLHSEHWMAALRFLAWCVASKAYSIVSKEGLTMSSLCKAFWVLWKALYKCYELFCLSCFVSEMSSRHYLFYFSPLTSVIELH